MNFKLLNIKNWLIFGSFVTTLLNISYTYASDTYASGQEYSTEEKTNSETNSSRNNNGNIPNQNPSQIIMRSNSFSSSNVNGIVQQFLQQYNYHKQTNNNNETEVKECYSTTNKTDINGNELKSELTRNRTSKCGADNNLLYDYTSNNTHLKDNKKEQRSNTCITRNKNGDSSINRQLYENGKLTDDFHKNYKNNDSEMKRYKEDNDSITKKEKESYNKFVNRYFKDTADNIASDNNNNKPKDYETQLNNIEKDMKKQFNNTFGYDNELKPNNNQCYGKDCYDINNKKNYNNKTNKLSKLYKYEEESDSKSISTTNKSPYSNINKNSYEEYNTDVSSNKNINSNKLEEKKNINQLNESSNSENLLEVPDNNWAKSLNKTSDKTINKDNNKSYLRKSYSPEIKNKSLAKEKK